MAVSLSMAGLIQKQYSDPTEMCLLELHPLSDCLSVCLYFTRFLPIVSFCLSLGLCLFLSSFLSFSVSLCFCFSLSFAMSLYLRIFVFLSPSLSLFYC